MAASKKKRFFRAATAMGLILAAAFCSSAFAAEVIKIGGSGTGLGTMKVLAEAYEKKHPGIKIQILPSLGSSGGIKAVLEGAIDIGISSRRLKDAEQSQGASAIEYCVTPMVFVSSLKTGKTGLTTTELEKMYAGEIPAWPNNDRIRLILRPEAEASTDDLKSISSGMKVAVATALAREGMIVAVTDQENVDAIAKTPGSLGVSTLTQLVSEGRQLTLFSYNGVKPSIENLSNNAYPLSRALFFVTSPKTGDAARKFGAFVRSSAGRAIVRKNGALPVPSREGR